VQKRDTFDVLAGVGNFKSSENFRPSRCADRWTDRAIVGPSKPSGEGTMAEDTWHFLV